MQSKTSPQNPNQHSYPELEEEFDISQEDIERAFHEFVEQDKAEPARDRSVVNVASIFGGVMLVVTALMILQLLGLQIGPDISFTRHVIGPSLIALIALLGWSGVRKKKKNKKDNLHNTPKLKVKRPGASSSYAPGSRPGAKTADTGYDEYAFTKRKRLLRSRKDKKFLGVCGGIANYFGFDPTIVRILFGLSMAFYGTPILLYFLLAIVMKKEPKA